MGLGIDGGWIGWEEGSFFYFYTFPLRGVGSYIQWGNFGWVLGRLVGTHLLGRVMLRELERAGRECVCRYYSLFFLVSFSLLFLLACRAGFSLAGLG